MFYSDGVYQSAGKAKPPIEESRPESLWERVDHAVLAVGWGVEDGKKYWKLQNSWGEDWGEDGFFRMARGTDESGIESIAVAADVVEDEQNGKGVADFFKQKGMASAAVSAKAEVTPEVKPAAKPAEKPAQKAAAKPAAKVVKA